MDYLCGTMEPQKKIDTPYSELVCDFMDVYSSELRHDEQAKKYSDVMSFAFWARRSSIQKRKQEYTSCNGQKKRLGKGIVFHIAPSNVPVNCMFTYAFGLLAGNTNIVRVPTKDFPQINCMLRVLGEVLKNEAFSDIYNMTCFVRYDREDIHVTEKFSSICDIRVIWGGDETINNIRKVKIPSRSIEITFSDRYSFGIVDVETVLKNSDNEMHSLANAFYNDTYLMDQNACSTPHLICFKKGCSGLTNTDINRAKEKFWSSIAKMATKYDLSDIKVSDKYSDLCQKIMIADHKVKKINKYDNYLYVLNMMEIPKDVVNWCRGRYGLFFEYVFESFEELSVLYDTKVQTCAVYGIEEDVIRNYLIERKVCGIDRIVPFGKTLDIDTTWDGYDLISCMSRVLG